MMLLLASRLRRYVHLLPTMLAPAGGSTSSHVPLAVSSLTSLAIAARQWGQSGLPRASASFAGSVPAGMHADIAYAGAPASSSSTSAIDALGTPLGSDLSVVSPMVDPSPVRMRHA